MTGNIFQRWIRLKHEANTEAVSAGLEAATELPGIDAMMHEPFDPASLPSIDSITADTDIVAFLKSDVPPELTRAALRRVWTSDPTIRDFIGVAENQWDFNDPNGIYGFGRLDVPESRVTFVAQVSLTAGEMPDLLGGTATPVKRQHERLDARQSNSTGSAISSCAVIEARAGAEPEPVVEEYDASCGRRRHGSALPR
jgi:hypothetical protein